MRTTSSRRSSLLAAAFLLVLAWPVQAQAASDEAASVVKPQPAVTAPPSVVDLSRKFPELGVKPLAIDFKSQPRGTKSQPRSVTLEAESTAGFSLKDIHAGPPFTVSRSSCDLAVKGSCSLDVWFSPTDIGAAEGAITVTDPAAGTTRVVTQLKGEGVPACSPTGSWECSGWSAVGPVVLAIGVFMLVWLTVRWNMIALPTRGLLLAEIDALRSRVNVLGSGAPALPVGLAQVLVLIDAAAKKVNPAKFPLEQLFWGRGCESAAWGLVHEAEELLAAEMGSEQVRAALEMAQTQLIELASAESKGLAACIQTELLKTVPALGDPMRAVLLELLDFVRGPQGDMQTTLAGLLAHPAPLMPADAAIWAGRFCSALAPQCTSLSARVTLILTALPASAQIESKALLEEARDVLLPRSATFATTLSGAIAATGGPVAPIWLPNLIEANDFISYTQLYSARLQTVLGASPTFPIARWRALLAEALGLIYERRDTGFATLMSWHNKASWLTMSGLLLILGLALALGNGTLFLLGAAGGLLSRLSRALYRQDVPTDYGASWTTLFLSPVVGALAGWSGVLLANLAVNLGVLGSMFQTIKWEGPMGPLGFGLAILLGFSERAFNAILSQLDDKIVGQSKQASAAPSTISISTAAALKAGQINQAYSCDLLASGGKSPYKWTLTSGSLPGGIELDPDGKLFGKPTVGGKVWTFTLQTQDSSGATASREFTLAV